MVTNSASIKFTRHDLKDLGRLTTVYIRKETSPDGFEVFNIHFADGATFQSKLSFQAAKNLILEHNLRHATIH